MVHNVGGFPGGAMWSRVAANCTPDDQPDNSGSGKRQVSQSIHRPSSDTHLTVKLPQGAESTHRAHGYRAQHVPQEWQAMLCMLVISTERHSFHPSFLP